MSENQVYQRLRGHLAELRMTAAAEALPAEGAAALFQVISQRYLKGSIALTTNLGIASWGKIFDDPMVAAAMLDRLLHRSVVLNITGESYRMRAHRARADKLRRGDGAP